MTKHIIVGKKTLEIQDRVWSCIRCSGTRKINLLGYTGIETLNCPHCNHDTAPKRLDQNGNEIIKKKGEWN